MSGKKDNSCVAGMLTKFAHQFYPISVRKPNIANNQRRGILLEEHAGFRAIGCSFNLPALATEAYVEGIPDRRFIVNH
jgi:hypothetical protein